MSLPQIIQGGMGAGVSGWRLANTVSSRGQLGVVSGTALDLILARQLQSGDPGGHLRRALSAFPDAELAERILNRYYSAGGRKAGEPFAAKPIVGCEPDAELTGLLIAANFVEVFLAKEGHEGQVGINYLHKLQPPLMASLFGALLAGVDAVLVGAGIPVEIPGILDRLCAGEAAELPLYVRNSTAGAEHHLVFQPPPSLMKNRARLKRPLFLPIVSSVTLASVLVKKCRGAVDGFVVESPAAGGHNAPPRGSLKLNEAGEPIYGPRDAIDLEGFRALGLPFWLAGACGGPQQLARAREEGAAGVQVGTLFAFAAESGLRDDLKRQVIHQCRAGGSKVFQDPLASPTGFPFQILSLEGTLSDRAAYKLRPRQCDLGYLREPYERDDGSVGWRCPAEDPEVYERKHGDPEDAVGRKCLCNGLMANIGLAQVRDGVEELPLLTCGSDLSGVLRVLKTGEDSYTAGDVLDYLLSDPVAKPAA